MIGTLPVRRAGRVTLICALAAIPGLAVLCAFVPAAGLAVCGAMFVIIVAQAIPRQMLPGACVGVVLLAALNVLPGPDLSTRQVGAGVHAQDAIVVILVVWLFAMGARTRFRHMRTVAGGFFLVSCLAAASWWIVTLVRTAQLPFASVSHSANYGRDLLFFFVLAPPLGEACSRRDFRHGLLAVTGIWSVILGFIFAVASFGHVNAGAVLHSTYVLEQSGISRQYSAATVVPVIALAFGVAAAFLAGDTRLRRAGMIVAVVSLVAVIASLTRAQYVASVAGLVLTVLAVRGSGVRRRFGRFILVAVAVLAVFVGAVFAEAPHGGAAHGISSIGSRIGSVFEVAGGSTQASQTLSVRSLELKASEQRLGNQWLLGLGFISPRDQYDPALYDGAVRNSDLGVFNVIITEGVIGTVLYYLPLLLALGALVGRLRRRLAWELFGAAFAILSALLGSATLIVLFSPSGCVAVAIAVGLGLGASSGAALTNPVADTGTPPRAWAQRSRVALG